MREGQHSTDKKDRTQRRDAFQRNMIIVKNQSSGGEANLGIETGTEYGTRRAGNVDRMDANPQGTHHCRLEVN